jgi:hypothetical protein
MAALTVHQADVDGVDLTFVSAGASGDTVRPDGTILVIVRNTDGTPKTVTIVRPGQSYGEDNPDPDGAVPATTGVRVFLIPPEFADPATGLVTITTSAQTGVTIAAVRA